MLTKIVVALALMYLVEAQRPFYAGLSPIGYPAYDTVDLSNRFGEDEDVPIDARGDRNLVNRISQMPINNQPFWYLNYRQYDALRQNPVVWPQRPNAFIDRFRRK